MKLTRALTAIVLISCFAPSSGCIALPKSYNTDAQPISPEMTNSPMKYYKVIDTLQPELKWKDAKKEGQTYDVCVWETKSEPSDDSWRGMPIIPKKYGNQICYVEGITENHYRIETPLKPKTCYHWSVRIRKGTEVSEWASFSQGVVGVVVGYGSHFPYGFITPDK